MMDKAVLVVEDDPDGREIIGRMLIRASIAVELTATGEDALQVLDPDEHGVVIIDLALPGIDGFEVLKQIREQEPTHNLHCIAITAFHTPSLKQRVIKEGFNDYFAKPLNDRRFAKAVQQVLTGT